MLPDVCRGTLVALAVVAGVGAADPPVRISKIVSGPKGHATLTNTASQPVTAWSLATITRTANGTHREVETVDGYLSEVTQGLPGSNPRLERLLPGQARDIAMEQLPPDATLEIVAVVLDDGTAVGDARVIKAIFARRVEERDALRSIVEAFQYALRAAQGEAALDLLHDRLLTIAPGESLLPCRAAIDAVDSYRQRGGDEEAIAESLRRYAGFVAREYEVAKRASNPRTP